MDFYSKYFLALEEKKFFYVRFVYVCVCVCVIHTPTCSLLKVA